MSRSLLLILYFLLGLTLFPNAANRADINADRAVNATDSVILQNILAGNLDVGNYDLPAVVVVAKQGGDFTDPADAAEWIATQSPSADNRFVIAVAPGRYTLDRTIVLPDYTTLRGLVRGECVIEYDDGPDSSYFRSAVVCDTVTGTGIENLTFTKTSATSDSSDVLVYMHNCRVTIRECTFRIEGKGNWSAGVMIESDVGEASLYIYDSTITASQPADGNGTCVALLLGGGAYLESHDCDIRADNQSPSNPAYALYQDIIFPQNARIIHSTLSAVSAGADLAFYFRRYMQSVGTATFYFCRILAGATNVSSNLNLLYCVSDDAVFP